MAVNGIDVSEFKGDIDWNAVRNSGVRFAMVRAGFGSSIENTDLQFANNMNGALANDIPVGSYWFSYAYTVEMARNEARVFMEVLAPYRGKMKYPLSFDWEEDSDRYARENGVIPSRTLITDMAIAFMQELEAGGWYAMNYTNLDYYYNKFEMDRLTAFDLWLADYNGTPDIKCGMQQTEDNGSIDGISGGVDTNIAYKDYPSLITTLGLNGYRPSGGEPTPEPPANGIVYNTVAEVPEWARPTVQNLLDKSYLKGEADNQLGLTNDMLRLFVVNERAGLYN